MLSIRDQFEDRAVLITGATGDYGGKVAKLLGADFALQHMFCMHAGYLGSLVLELLLRIGHIRKAYLLLRPKNGVHQQQRLEDLLKSPVFCLHHSPDSLKQVTKLCSLYILLCLDKCLEHHHAQCAGSSHVLLTTAPQHVQDEHAIRT